jgi:hypothetical protein
MKMSTKHINEQILDLMGRDDSVDAPRDSIKWARNLFRSRVAEPKASIVQRVLAVLTADLAPNRAAFGERSGTAGQARQMLFAAGDNSIDLRIMETDGLFQIRGQILGKGFEGGNIELASHESRYSASLNDLSEFGLDGVEKGAYTLTLTGGETEIAIEGLELS